MCSSSVSCQKGPWAGRMLRSVSSFVQQARIRARGQSRGPFCGAEQAAAAGGPTNKPLPSPSSQLRRYLGSVNTRRGGGGLDHYSVSFHQSLQTKATQDLPTYLEETFLQFFSSSIVTCLWSTSRIGKHNGRIRKPPSVIRRFADRLSTNRSHRFPTTASSTTSADICRHLQTSSRLYSDTRHRLQHVFSTQPDQAAGRPPARPAHAHCHLPAPVSRKHHRA